MAGPDLQIRGGGGGGAPRLWDIGKGGGGGGVSKNFFSALRTSFCSKNKGGQPPPAPPLDPSLFCSVLN